MQQRSSSISVVSKAAKVLKACHELGGGLSLGTIARAVNLPRSTVQRIVQSLVAEGLLTSDGSARSITLGPDLLAMGANAATIVVEKVQPILRKLSAETGETVDLSRFNRDHMVFLNQITGTQRLRAVSAVGDTFPLHCTANGKAVLAQLDEQSTREICARGLRQYTHHTVTGVRELRRRLQEIRQTGVAYDIEEHSMGICAVGIAIRDKANQFYAISIPVPTVRFNQYRLICERALLSAAEPLRGVLCG